MSKGGQSKQEKKKLIILVEGRLPFYVPVPAETKFAPSRVGEQNYSISFRHNEKADLPGVAETHGLDDGRGNLIYSIAFVEFPITSELKGLKLNEYEAKALQFVNHLLLSIKYVSTNYRIRHVKQFVQTKVQLYEIQPNGEHKLIEGHQGASFGPHGVSPVGITNNEGLTRVWLHFNGLRPMYPSSILLIDANYYLDLGDISHAIFDIATSLQIHISSLLQEYGRVQSSLLELQTDQKSVYTLYDKVLEEITGVSLHQRPDLFIQLEYIWQIRNSIAHRWIPQFQLASPFKDKTKYLEQHTNNDGHIVTEHDEVLEMRNKAGEIFEFAEEGFYNKFDANSF